MSRWIEARLLVDRLSVDVVSGLLFEHGTTGVQEDWPSGQAPPVRQPWDTGPPPPLPDRVLIKAWWDAALVQRDRVEEAVRPWLRAEPAWQLTEEEDWAAAWKAGFKRLVVTESLAVAPPWEAQPGDLVIEPGMAFGTGEHPTTRACLEAITRLAQPGGRCLDVGCGTGVLALAAARMGMTVAGVDTDVEAVRSARDNATRNGLVGDFRATPLAQVQGRYELVVANLYAEVLVAMAPDLSRLCGCDLVLAGVLADRAQRVLDALSHMTLVRRQQDGEWVSLELRR